MNVARIGHSFGSEHPVLPPALTDAAVAEEVRTWMARRLKCVAGRREFRLGRYMIRIACGQTVPAVMSEYVANLKRGKSVACLMVFNEPQFYDGMSDVSNTFRFLANQMTLISKVPCRDLAEGAALTTSVELRCPVTGRMTVYDDFECIAFCPQSADAEDALYDPLMYAPYPAVNVSSDTFGFSRFVADNAQTLWGKPVHEESDIDRIGGLFDICVDRWHRIATGTIRNFISVTDTSRCPVHFTEDERHWVAAHKDPAFAEQIKEAHSHELPVVYARRIADRWLAHFSGEHDYHASGVAREGTPL